MKILTVNAGSSSRKFKLFENKQEIFTIHLKNYSENQYSYQINAEEQQTLSKRDYEYSFEFVKSQMIEKKLIKGVEDLSKIIHRIVHGGEEFQEPAVLSQENLEKIEKYNEFAPLHNPVALEIVSEISQAYPALVQYGVFDTSFHLTNPKENFLYGLPYGYYENLKVRKYGFHGISYSYILKKLEQVTNGELKDKKIIALHLGSGSSVCAIREGKSFNHSFGFTPDENLIMATRSGEVDYDAINYVRKKLNLSDDEVTKLVNYESGLLGISGYSKDMKKLLEDYNSNERAKLAIDMYVNKIVDFIAQFFVQLGGCDYLVFTGGIGSGSDVIRQMIIDKLKVLNIFFNKDLNNGKIDVSDPLDLSIKDSSTQVWVIPTNEELEMVISVG